MYVLPKLYLAASISLKIPFMTKAARKKVQRSAMGWEIWIPRRPRIGVRISSAGIRKSPWRADGDQCGTDAIADRLGHHISHNDHAL